MKKMIKKVIVAVLAMAMALGMMTVVASADTKDCSATTDWVVSGTFNGWGTTTMTAVGDGRYYCAVDVDAAGTLQFYIKGTVDGTLTEVKDKEYRGEATKNDFVIAVDEAGVYNIILNPAEIKDYYWTHYYVPSGVVVSKAILPSEVEAAIDAIGEVKLTEESKALIDVAKAKVNSYLGRTDDISNYDELVAAEDKWDELVANGAGTLKLHVKHEWDVAAVYTYGVSNGDAHAAGDWPGTVLVANANNEGWEDVTVTTESAVDVIVNNNNNGKEVKTRYVVAGEYWITVGNDAIVSVSSTAPSGWSTGAVTPPPVEEETTTAAEEDDDEEEETTTAAEEDDDEETTTTTAAGEEDDDETTTTAADEDTNTYHVAGEAGLCGEAWNPAKNQMTKNADGTWSIKFTNVKAGTYAFKIATNGAWDNGEYNLEGDASNNGPNASITVEEDGSTVIISFDGEKAIITMNEVPAGAGDDTPAGENSMVAIFAILAVLAAAGVVTVVVAKRRAIEE